MDSWLFCRTARGIFAVTKAAALVVLLLVIAEAAAAQAKWDPYSELHVPVPPVPFKGNGKTHLSYELHITNYGTEPLTVASIAVLGDNSEKPLAEFSGPSLRGMIQPIGKLENKGNPAKIDSGRRVAAFLWITLDDGADLPQSLRHRLAFAAEKEGEGEPGSMLLGPEMKLPAESPLVIGPPLKGGSWLAGNGPSNISGHRRAMLPVGGRAAIAQRFAIDWVMLNPEGGTRKGDAKENENYLAHGQEAIAVADGTVVALKDGIPENVPGIMSRAVEIDLDTVGGNFVTLDLGNGKFAFYAHLQPGSLRVSVGDRVKRGQVLGLVGNSGNSTEPHLHFHLSDGPSNLGSEGLPFVHDSFTEIGSGWGFKPTPDAKSVTRTGEIPMMNAVVQFQQ